MNLAASVRQYGAGRLEVHCHEPARSSRGQPEWASYQVHGSSWEADRYLIAVLPPQGSKKRMAATDG